MHIGRIKGKSVVMITAVVLTALMTWGCAGKINHIYDLSTKFGGLRSYNWGPSSAPAQQFALVESNVQYLTDRVLMRKGFVKTSEKPDFMISINYDYDIDSYGYGSTLQMLTLKMYTPENKKLIWQGTASGANRTDKDSRDLKKTVERILAKFPPNRNW